jgi:hypothetical protein
VGPARPPARAWSLSLLSLSPLSLSLSLSLSLLGMAAAPVARAELTSKGELAVEGRAFPDDGDELTHDQGLGLFGRLEARHQHAPFEEKLRAYGRLDHYDDRRSTLVLEEAFVQVRQGRVRLRVGADLVNWTATEAFHPADVINARNLDSDLESLEKVGEPMAAGQVTLAEGTTAALMVMPVYMKTLLASPRSRLSFAPGVDFGGRRALYDRGGHYTDDHFGPQLALRVQQVVGQADVSVHALEQMDRLQPIAGWDIAEARPVPIYLTVRQAGGTYQHVLGPVIVKLEAAYRWFETPVDTDAPVVPLDVSGPVPVPGAFTSRDHGTVAVGLEYGIPHASGGDSTLILEGQAVLGARDAATRRSLTPFQRDLFAGYRLALGDEDSKELVVGTIVDLERRGELLVNVSYQQRLGETFSVRAGLRIFAARGREDDGDRYGLAPLRESDHLRVTLTRHF